LPRFRPLPADSRPAESGTAPPLSRGLPSFKNTIGTLAWFGFLDFGSSWFIGGWWRNFQLLTGMMCCFFLGLVLFSCSPYCQLNRLSIVVHGFCGPGVLLSGLGGRKREWRIQAHLLSCAPGGESRHKYNSSTCHPENKKKGKKQQAAKLTTQRIDPSF